VSLNTTHESTASGDEACRIDIRNLATPLAAVAGNSPIVIIASPKQAMSLRLRAGPDFPFEILSSSALASGTVVAVAPIAVVSGIDPAPKIETSEETVINFDDSSPQNVVTGGTPGAGSTRSLWQVDAIALRLTMQMAWGLRCDGAVSWTSSVVW
jgi:hypothetical protein